MKTNITGIPEATGTTKSIGIAEILPDTLSVSSEHTGQGLTINPDLVIVVPFLLALLASWIMFTIIRKCRACVMSVIGIFICLGVVFTCGTWFSYELIQLLP